MQSIDTHAYAYLQQNAQRSHLWTIGARTKEENSEFQLKSILSGFSLWKHNYNFSNSNIN